MDVNLIWEGERGVTAVGSAVVSMSTSLNKIPFKKFVRFF
jgi:hypothetical protein